MQQVSALRKDPGVVFPIPANVHAETVVSVRHYTDRLFSFRITRPQSFRFRSGEFVMIGLPNAEKPVFRAYSIASPSWDEEIEFFSIKVPDGPLTSELQKIVPGDTVLMRQKSTGTLVNDALTPGKRLFMISTGTGIAPFASLVRAPETFEKFEQIVITHTCRDHAELAYGVELAEGLAADPLIGEMTEGRVTLYSTTTREITPRMGRITRLIESGRFYEDLAIAPLDPETDRIMICGSMHMLNDVKELVEKLGFEEGSNSKPSSFVVERAFVG
ncbi:MAG: ferredoxin--NADP reductase [Alphaproteobacteria bacterium]|nr:ferredoxin--NADP reductase [Alphaproteobacteria bacterium]MBU0804024.1 ferredoxin--NADP reductase [Alphaproteobacteria bacterium]MBU0872679.1 ferredoxin--NADP reductase [Alphaproteobacteria bacterium]MBU1402951.1 ferredoxin--NADP reductase [Alphaproteobacteria bacterium]MBU1593593.1 ferredoxin--NADP reductase [Alphaproteobacteria bacterium]